MSRRNPGGTPRRESTVSTDSRTRSARETLRRAARRTGYKSKRAKSHAAPTFCRSLRVLVGLFVFRHPSEKRADRASADARRGPGQNFARAATPTPWPTNSRYAERSFKTRASRVIPSHLAYRASTPIDEERAPQIAFPRPPRRSRNGVRSSSLLRGRSLPRDESRRRTRFAAPNTLRRARRASPRRTRVRHEETYPSRRASSSPDRLSHASFFRLPIRNSATTPSPPVGTRRPSSTSRRRPRWIPPTTSSTATGAPRTPAWATSRARWRMPRRPSPTSRTGPRGTRARAPRYTASAGSTTPSRHTRLGSRSTPRRMFLNPAWRTSRPPKQEPSAPPLVAAAAPAKTRWATSRRCCRRPT